MYKMSIFQKDENTEPVDLYFDSWTMVAFMADNILNHGKDIIISIVKEDE